MDSVWKARPFSSRGSQAVYAQGDSILLRGRKVVLSQNVFEFDSLFQTKSKLDASAFLKLFHFSNSLPIFRNNPVSLRQAIGWFLTERKSEVSF
jgi:hypothetical protein